MAALVSIPFFQSCKTAEMAPSEPVAVRETKPPLPDLKPVFPSPPETITIEEPPKVTITYPESPVLIADIPLTITVELIDGDPPNTVEITGSADSSFQTSMFQKRVMISEDGPYDLLLNEEGVTEYVVNRNSYYFRVRGGKIYSDGKTPLWGPWSKPIKTVLNLPAEPPIPSEPSLGLLTYDFSPTFSWKAGGIPEELRIEIISKDTGYSHTNKLDGPAAEYSLPEKLIPNENYQWRLSGRYGPLYTTWSEWVTFTVTSRNMIRQPYFSLNSTVFHTSPAFPFYTLPAGIEAYRFTLTNETTGETVLETEEQDRSRFSIEDELSEQILYSVSGQYRNDDNIWCPPKKLITFTVDPLEIPTAAVIPPGETAAFQMGREGTWPDEMPVHTVILTVPYEMAVYELTNRKTVRLLNWAVSNGHAEIREDGVYDAYYGNPILGLGDMNYGNQFGIQRDGTRLAPVSGREEHPAVGITWYGAAAICNILSIHHGYTPAYSLENWEWDKQSQGYRLPTEAEWEYAARNGSSLLFPWGTVPSGRRANYYRSFDAWEDPAEPYTRNGGPTAPVGSFENASVFGIYDLFGNVWEWCWDLYDPNQYTLSEEGVTDPTGPESAPPLINIPGTEGMRISRSCAWNTPANDFRSTNRGRYKPEGKSFSMGMRPARNLP